MCGALDYPGSAFLVYKVEGIWCCSWVLQSPRLPEVWGKPIALWYFLISLETADPQPGYLS